MIALIRKELRDQRLFAALVAAGMLLFLREVFSSEDPARVWDNLRSNSLRLEITVITAAVFSALGARQGRRERSEGSWPFLVHRPVSRGRIAFAKFWAAALFALVCIVLPLLLVHLWIYRGPWPFDPLVVLQLAVRIGAGLPFYFAALSVAACPPHRRLQSALLFGWPLLILAAVVSEDLTPPSMLPLVVGATVLIASVAHHILSTTNPDALPTRSLLGFSGGALAVHALMLLFLPPALESVPQNIDALAPMTSWHVTSEGIVVGLSENGRAIERNASGEETDYAGPQDQWLPMTAVPRFASRPWLREGRYIRVPQHDIVHPFEWYFDRANNYYVGYAADGSGRRYLGPGGFSDSPPVASFFGLPVSDPLAVTNIVAFTEGAFRVDWRQQRWTQLPTGIDHLSGTGSLPNQQTPGMYYQETVLFGLQAAYLLRHTGEVLAFAHAGPFGDSTLLSFGELPEGGYVVLAHTVDTESEQRTFSIFDQNARLQRRVRTPPQPLTPPTVVDGIFGPAISARPLLYGFTHPPAYFAALHLDATPSREYVMARLRTGWTTTHLRIALALALLLALLSLLVTRRSPVTVRMASAVIALALGPSSILLWFLVRRSLQPNQLPALPESPDTDSALFDPEWTGL